MLLFLGIIFSWTLYCKGTLLSEERLIRHLFANYSRMVRPVLTEETRLHVYMSVELVQIIDVDAPKQMVRTMVWTRLKWRNELLTWDPNKYDGIKHLRISRQFVWLPDITLYNAYGQSSQNKEKQNSDDSSLVIISHNGNQSYFQPLLLSSTCTMEARDFPSDTHLCYLQFGSWSFNEKEIEIHEDGLPIITSSYVNNSEWELRETSKKKGTTLYACCSTKYSHMSFYFKIHRKELFYVFNIYLPCIIVLSCLVAGHSLPPQSGEKITLALTVLLTFFVFLQISSSYVPKSENMSSLSIFLLATTAGITLSTFVTCVVLGCHFKSLSELDATLPSFTKSSLFHFICKVFSVPTAGKLDYISSTSNEPQTELEMKKQIMECSFARTLRRSTVPDIKKYRKFKIKKTSENRMIERHLEEILHILKSNLKETQLSQESSKRGEVWQSLALVIDRASLAIFITLISIISIYIFT